MFPIQDNILFINLIFSMANKHYNFAPATHATSCSKNESSLHSQRYKRGNNGGQDQAAAKYANKSIDSATALKAAPEQNANEQQHMHSSKLSGGVMGQPASPNANMAAIKTTSNRSSSSGQQSKSHSKRARNRSLEMVIDEKADSSPSRSSYGRTSTRTGQELHSRSLERPKLKRTERYKSVSCRVQILSMI